MSPDTWAAVWGTCLLLAALLIATMCGRVFYVRSIRKPAANRPTYDDMARAIAAEQESTRARREHIDGIRAAEVHE